MRWGRAYARWAKRAARWSLGEGLWWGGFWDSSTFWQVVAVASAVVPWFHHWRSTSRGSNRSSSSWSLRLSVNWSRMGAGRAGSCR